MSPELAFLLDCLRGSPPRVGARNIDARALAELADFHGVGPWLHRWTRGAVGSATYSAYARRNLCLVAGAARACAVLAERGIPTRIVKGPVLAHLLHGDSALRQSGDIDLFVKPKDAPAAIEALRSSGARMLVPLDWVAPATAVRWNSELPFFWDDQRLEMDLHWNSAPAHSPFQLPANSLFDGERWVTVAGRTFALPAPEPLFVFLTLHGTRHLWERLIWVSDLVSLIGRGLEWPRLWRLAREGGLQPALRVALALTIELAAVRLPEPVSLTTRESAALAFVLQRLRAGVIPEPKTRELLRFQAALAPGTATLSHLCGLAFKPTSHDWRIVRLRPPFSAFYYPLRLARLALAYGRHLRSGEKEALIASNPG